MKRDFIVEDKGQFKLLQNARKIGGFMVGELGVVPLEKVLPPQRFAHQPISPLAVMEERPEKVYTYFHWRGYILAAHGLDEQEASIDYKTYKLVRVAYPDSHLTQKVDAYLIKHPSADRDYLLNTAPIILNELEKKFLDGEGLTDDEKFAMRLYFLNANNFSVLRRGVQLNAPAIRAWWATRTHLWTGRLREGLKVTEPNIVQGVPKDQDINGRYHHILGAYVWNDNGMYKMITEEQVIAEKGLPQVFVPHQYSETNANFRVLLNIYQSQEAENWQFVSTYAEDTTEDPVKERRFRGYAGNQVLWQYIYKNPFYRHYKGGTPTNLPVDFNRPSGRHYRITRSGGVTPPLQALGNIFQVALHKYISSDGLDWQFQWTKSFKKGIPL